MTTTRECCSSTPTCNCIDLVQQCLRIQHNRWAALDRAAAQRETARVAAVRAWLDGIEARGRAVAAPREITQEDLDDLVF